MNRACRLCGSGLPTYAARRYSYCAACESRILATARQRSRPVIYDDFMRLRPKEAGGWWLHIIKDVLVRAGFECHEQTRKESWTCGFDRKWAAMLGMKTHFYSLHADTKRKPYRP